MIRNSQVTGIGYGFFEQRYNLYQASLVNSGQVGMNQWANTGYIKTAYNETSRPGWREAPRV
jgi:hypothetical protein